MPQVSRYGGLKVATSPLPGVRKSAAETPISEGAGLAEARAQTGQAIAGVGAGAFQLGANKWAEVVQQERDFADQVANLAADTSLVEWSNARLRDADKGALAQHGKAAFGLPEQVSREYEDYATKVESTLTTDRQRMAFARSRAQRKIALMADVHYHTSAETERFAAGEHEAAIAANTTAAIGHATNPPLLALDLAKIDQTLQERAVHLGLGPEARAQARLATRSDVHLGVIDRLLAEDKPQFAQAYLDEAKDEIAGDKLATLEKALEIGGLRQRSQAKADEILQTATTREDALAAVRAIDDPKLRDEVQARVRQDFDERKQADAEAHHQLLITAGNLIDRTGRFDRIPPATVAQMTVQEKASLQQYARERASGTLTTDWQVFYSRMTEAGDDPQAFAERKLFEDRGRLGDTEFKRLLELRLNIKEGNRQAADKELVPFQTRAQLVDDTLTLYGIDPNAKPDSAEGKAIAQLRHMVEQRVELLQSVTGRKATNQDIQSELDQILSTSVTVPGSWWNIVRRGKPFFDVRKRLPALTIDDVPKALRPQIEAALTARRQPVSDATVLNLYLEHLLRQQGVAK